MEEVIAELSSAIREKRLIPAPQRNAVEEEKEEEEEFGAEMR